MIAIGEFTCSFISQATKREFSLNCSTFTGLYFIRNQTITLNNYNKFTNIIDSLYNKFINKTIEDEDKILITYLSPCLGEVDTAEMAFLLERIDENGNVAYECINSLTSDSVVLYYPDDITFNSLLNAYQVNGFFVISNRYSALLDIAVEEIDLFGFAKDDKDIHNKIARFLKDGLIYIYFGDIQLTYNGNKTLKYYLYPDTHIKKFNILINRKVFREEFIHFGFYISLFVEVDSYEQKTLPIFIIKRNPFDTEI